MVATLPAGLHFPWPCWGRSTTWSSMVSTILWPRSTSAPTDARPDPSFLEVCRTHWDEIEALLAVRHVQTTDCGRSALIGPGLTWLASRLTRPPALVDVGTSAGLSSCATGTGSTRRARCDRSGRVARSRSACRIVAGDPPSPSDCRAWRSRVGIVRSPLDGSNPDDARWLLACVWPDTGRLERTAASIRLARAISPNWSEATPTTVLPGVLADLPRATPAIVMTTWALAYFSLEQRHRFAEILERASQTRPVAWLSAEGPGIVEAFAADAPERTSAPATCWAPSSTTTARGRNSFSP